jgi:metal-responsive CopG/Arc/MetJ family transcriptional regulator
MTDPLMMVQDSMAPKKKTAPMERIDMRLPAATLKILDELADKQSVDRPEIIRRAVDRGIPHLLQDDQVRVEYEIKGKVLEKLGRRSDKIIQAIEQLERDSSNEEIVRLLREAISG